MPFDTVMDAVFTIKEGIREASLVPLPQVSIKADKILGEICKDMFMISSISQLQEDLLNMMKKGRFEDKALAHFEAQKKCVQEMCIDLGNILPDVLSKRAFHSRVEKLDLDYIMDIDPNIGGNVEGCGVVHYSLQDFVDQKEKINMKMIHALASIVPSVHLIFFDKRNKRKIKEKYDEILEIRNRKLGSIKGVFATKDSIYYSLLEVAHWGELLGYPPCCVGTYVELKRRARLSMLQKSSKFYLPPEDYLARQGWFGLYEYLGEKLLKDGFKSEKIVNLAKDEMYGPFYSKPYHLFYPCSITCFNAIRIGKQIEKQAEKIDPKLATCYRISLIGRFLSPMIIELEIPIERIFGIHPGKEEEKNKLFSEIKKVRSYSGLGFFKKFEEPSFSEGLWLSKKPYNRVEYYITLLQHHFLVGESIQKLDTLEEISSIYETIYSPY
jgi:hypothetical protein